MVFPLSTFSVSSFVVLPILSSFPDFKTWRFECFLMFILEHVDLNVPRTHLPHQTGSTCAEKAET